MLGGSGAMMITSRHDTFWDACAIARSSPCVRGSRLAWRCTGRPALRVGARVSRRNRRFPVIFGVGHLTIFADNDEQNLDTGFVAAVDCAKRWNASSHQSASIHMPTEAGKDFADLFRAGA